VMMNAELTSVNKSTIINEPVITRLNT
jgi:hypothetical protein